MVEKLESTAKYNEKNKQTNKTNSKPSSQTIPVSILVYLF